MDKLTLRRLVAILDAGQEEHGVGLDIAPERYLDIAGGAALDDAEARIVLGSPLARNLLQLANCYVETVPDAETDTPGASVVLAPRLLAAKATDSDERPFELDVGSGDGGTPLAVLTITKGFGGDLAYLLGFRLEPAAWLESIVDGIAVTLVEPGPGGIVWLRGITDADGVIRSGWPEGELSPRARLERLAGQRLNIVVG